MINVQLALVGVALVAFNIASTKHLEKKPSWTTTLSDLYSRDVVFPETPERNRSCGIARWDESHVLIYFMTATKRLVMRAPVETQVGGRSFSVQIVRTDNGGVEESVN